MAQRSKQNRIDLPSWETQRTEGVRMLESRVNPESVREEFQNEEYRYAYAEDLLNAWIATQIVVIREQRGLSQKQLGELIGTKQPGVSRLENVNHSTWKTETLKRIARALGVRLKISFETFGTLLEEDQIFSRYSLGRPRFEDDPVFACGTGASRPEAPADDSNFDRHRGLYLVVRRTWSPGDGAMKRQNTVSRVRVRPEGALHASGYSCEQTATFGGL